VPAIAKTPDSCYYNGRFTAPALQFDRLGLDRKR
jgi:hypothetical protein